MKRVAVYVDGFNLFYGLKNKRWKKYYWLDLCLLAKNLLRPNQILNEVHYFTAIVRAAKGKAEAFSRQAVYLDALKTLPQLRMHFGFYLEKSKQCLQCGSEWIEYEEKMTDVNIASQMLTDAFDDRFDTAFLISGDSDLTQPINIILDRFPEKRIIIALPPNRRSTKLEQAATGYFIINETALRRSQLPSQVRRADGYLLQRPTSWH